MLFCFAVSKAVCSHATTGYNKECHTAADIPSIYSLILSIIIVINKLYFILFCSLLGSL